jgi:hypothetical protein
LAERSLGFPLRSAARIRLARSTSPPYEVPLIALTGLQSSTQAPGTVLVDAPTVGFEFSGPPEG